MKEKKGKDGLWSAGSRGQMVYNMYRHCKEIRNIFKVCGCEQSCHKSSRFERCNPIHPNAPSQASRTALANPFGRSPTIRILMSLTKDASSALCYKYEAIVDGMFSSDSLFCSYFRFDSPDSCKIVQQRIHMGR